MTPETKELAALAAAIAGKCQPCFAYHIQQARALGIPEADISEIIQLAKDIRASGDKHSDEFAARRMHNSSDQGTT